MNAPSLDQDLGLAQSVEEFAGDLYEYLVELPSLVAPSRPLETVLPDLGGEHRSKSMPPKSDRLMADVDASLVNQILDIPER